MNFPKPDSLVSSKQSAPDWVRKRDGEVVRFELDQLTRALQFATDDIGQNLSPDELVELARMASFFVQANVNSEVVGSEEISEWVEKSLREIGQELLTESFAKHHERKAWARNSLWVKADESFHESSATESTPWNKSRIVKSLRARANLDTRRARDIASQVERAVLRGRFVTLTTNLVRELVNNELIRCGHTKLLTPSRQVRIGTAELSRQLALPGGPANLGRFVRERIWREYSLDEVISTDVAEAVRRRLLLIHNLGSPANLAASCVDCGSLARQAQGSRASITQFGTQLSRSLGSSSLIVAIDRVEYWLTMVAEPGDTPSKLAEMFWLELNSRLRHSPVQCVLNLYGGLPQGMDSHLGAGPLFSQQPLSTECEFAGAVCQEILGWFQRDAADWPNLRVDWHWYPQPDAVQTALVQRIMRVIAERHSVGISFERGSVSVGDGLRRVGSAVRPVLDFVGVSLPIIFRDAGSPRSLPALEDGLRLTIQLAVRAAVQKREFLRRLASSVDVVAVDAAVVALCPIGLDWTVRQFVGRSFVADEGALKLAESLVRFVRETAEREARHYSLGIVVDSRCDVPAYESSASNRGEPTGEDDSLEGLRPVANEIGLRRLVHSVGRLHAVAQAGTLTLDQIASTDRIADSLLETIEWACRSTEVVRLNFTPNRSLSNQTLVPWPES